MILIICLHMLYTHNIYTNISRNTIKHNIRVMFWPFDRPKMPFKVMHRKKVTHSNGSYERKPRGRKLADEMRRAKKNPMVHYRVMHQKRVTSELHDSYFRLMTIKHSISKIEWASNDYITQLSSTSQLNWVPVPVEFDAQGGSWSCQ